VQNYNDYLTTAL